MYSDTSADPVEPPEFLSEGERKVFEMIKDGLQPTKLEVRLQNIWLLRTS
jgi:hypothetical protein